MSQIQENSFPSKRRRKCSELLQDMISNTEGRRTNMKRNSSFATRKERKIQPNKYMNRPCGVRRQQRSLLAAVFVAALTTPTITALRVISKLGVRQASTCDQWNSKEQGSSLILPMSLSSNEEPPKSTMSVQYSSWLLGTSKNHSDGLSHALTGWDCWINSSWP